MADLNLQALRDALSRWAAQAVGQGARAVYLFGSLIHKDGAQFMDSSDVDLVLVMPDLDDAAARHRWLEAFAELKVELETTLFRLLRRSGREPIVSVVAVTDRELALDVHKDGHRAFFTANRFRNLTTLQDADGIPGAGSETADRFVAASLAFAQKVRNEYLGVSANGAPTLAAYSGEDPLPKRTMRAAAMAARAIGEADGPGAEHDVQEGLDLLTSALYHLRSKAPVYSQLQDVVSVRRRARGIHRDVEPGHQLLLAEIIYDLVFEVAGTSPDRQGNDAPSARGERGATERTGTAAPAAGGEQLVAPPAPPATYASSTVLFAERFMSAFPGVRSLTWYAEPAEVEERLMLLLAEPLTFTSGHPIWWWRGGNLQIDSLRKLEDGTFLLNVDELRIARIAAVPGSTYQRSFVYVRADAMEPTGLYEIDGGKQAERIARHGYDSEEYGLVDGAIPITRASYDDGAARIGGRIVDVSGRAELRVRYLTPYNFVIAANGSPINNSAFDARLVGVLNRALRADEEKELADLASLVEGLPLRTSARA
jgi:hypothetical protein